MKKTVIPPYAKELRETIACFMAHEYRVMAAVLLFALVLAIVVWTNSIKSALVSVEGGHSFLLPRYLRSTIYTLYTSCEQFVLLTALALFAGNYLLKITERWTNRWFSKLSLLLTRWLPGYWLAVSNTETGAKHIIDASMPDQFLLDHDLICLGEKDGGMEFRATWQDHFVTTFPYGAAHFEPYTPQEVVRLHQVSKLFPQREVLLTDDYRLAKRWLKASPSERLEIESSLK